MSYAQHVSKKATAQSAPIPGREKEMEQMESGGYAFVMPALARMRRFLILGCEGSTYYSTEQKLTVQNAQSINEAFVECGVDAINLIIKVSTNGLAPKNKPALFALALAFSYDGHNSKDIRAAAKVALPTVARTASDLLFFVSQVNELRGWGRGLKSAVADWFQHMPVERLAYQAVKYKQRDGWALRDLLRLTHPKANNPVRDAVYKYIISDYIDARGSKQPPEIVVMAKQIAGGLTEELVAEAIERCNVPREAVRTELLNSKRIWEALLKSMPLHAMLRNLGKMSSLGLIAPFSASNDKIINDLSDVEKIKKSRLHPFNILNAMRVYAQGHGDKGKLSWNPEPVIMQVLNTAFFAAFDNIQASGKKILIGLDVSGSMASGNISGFPNISPAQVAGVLGLVFTQVEPKYHTIGFDTKVVMRTPLINNTMSVENVLRDWRNVNGGGTDCTVPIQYAIKNKMDADVIVIVTDEESYGGTRHVTQAFAEFKKTINRDAKLVVIATTASRTTLVDENDPDQLCVVGFDSNAFDVIHNFIKGEF